MRAVPLCLPRLAQVALYLDEPNYYDNTVGHFVADPAPEAPDQSGPGVCNAIGRLVTAGVMPALGQARLSRHTNIPMNPCLQ